MPTIRYQIRNEYGLADPELYRAADKDDPEALLEGVAMAGLVGVLRQLGDLAEFAAEIFHDLHEEVTATAARGHGLMLRVKQLEAEFPSIEKAFLSQTCHSRFAYNEGFDWHANLRMDQNLVTQGEMPRFILDSYEECRGPPRLFMLDKFDVAGAGACLKRYSDPSFFKVDLASSGMMEEEVQREKKSRKIKKKGSRWRNGETTESFLAPFINSNLQPATSDKVSEKVPTRLVKLKSRNSINPDTTNRRSYMEQLLEVHSPEQKLLSVNSISYAPIMINSIDSSETAPEVREIVIDTPADSTIVRERNPTQSPTKQEVAYLPTNELENQKAKDVKMLEIIPGQNILTESRTKSEFTVDGYRSDETEKSPPALLEVNQKNSLADATITTEGGLDGYRSDDMNKTEVGVDGYRPVEAENSPPALPEVNKKKSLADDKCTTEGGFDGYRSDDISSDLDNYMDALNSMESEIETDSESRAKSDPHFLNMRSQGIDSGINERQQELPAQFLEPDSFENFTASRGVNNMLKNGLSSLSESNSSGDLADTWPSQEKMSSFDVPANQEICLDETHDKTPEELQRNGEVREFISSFHLLPSETCNAKESDVTSIKSETGEASSGCVADSILSPINVCPQGSEAQSVTVDSKETFSGYVEGTREVAPQLDSNVEELPKYADYPEIFSDELLHLSDMGGLPLVGKDVLQVNHPIEYADEAQSVTVHPNETFAGYVEGTHDVAQQLDGNMEEVSKFAGNSNIFPDELLLLSDLEGSSPARKDVPEETHPAECVEEQISANIADRLGMLDRLFQTQDESNFDEAPTQYAEGSLLTVEEALHLEGEQQPLIEQDTEVCSGKSILPTIPAISPNINSTIVQPDDLAGDMENVEQPEDLAAEISSNDVKGTQEVVRDLDGKLQCAVETSQAFDGMAFPEPAENFIISSDDLFLVYDISEKTNTAEDAEELFSEDMANTQGESIPEEVPTGCVKDLPASFTEQDTEACIGESTSATNCDISLEISPIIMHSDGLAAEIENRVAPGEDSNADDIGQSKILMPKIVPLELEHFSNAEEPQESHEVGSSELLPLSSGNEAFADDMQVQSNEPVCAVIDAPDPVADNLEFPCGSIVSNLHKDALQNENLTGCDDSLSEYVIVEADDDDQGPCSIYSLDASGFDVQLQEDYLPGDAIRNQHNVEINVTSSPKNITVLPQNEERPVSFPAVSSSELPILDSSHSSDAKLLDGVCYPILSEPSIDEENLIYSSENEDSSSKEGLSPSTHFLVEPAILLQASNEPNVISSYQEVEHLEAPDIQFERACSDEQHITQSNSKDIDDQPSEPEPCAIISNGVINELDIPLSNTGIHEQLKAEASVPSECTSEISVGSLASHVSDAGLALIANSSTAISETSPQESSEPWPGEPTSHFQLQVVEETPPLPPLPPMEWRMGKLRLGSLTPGGDIAQPPTVASPFMELSTMDEKHPQGSVTTGVEMVQPANPFAALPVLEYERFQHGILTSEGEIARPSRLSELPTIVDEETHQHGTLFLEGEVVNPSNPFLVVSHTEDEKYSSGHDAPVPALEDETTQYPQLLEGEVWSIQDKRPQLGQLLPSLELERSRHETLSIEKNPMLPLNPFLVISSAEEWKHQYGYGVYGGESLHHLNLSAPLPLTGPNMPPYGFLYSMGENPSTIYDFMVPAMEGGKPSWKHRSIRDRPRDPLIEAVAAHDKSTMRKVSEFHRPSARPVADERDSLLEQIRSKSFNLKPANPSKPNVEGPPTNLKVAAIVEKANKIRQAFVGSDEDDDDGESWSDS